MSSDRPEPMECFEVWLLHRVSQAVEAGEIPADLLMELQAEFEAAREVPQQQGHAAAVRQIADLAGVSEEQAADTLSAIEAQPRVTREMLMRRIAEAWLEGQRETNRDLQGRG